MSAEVPEARTRRIDEIGDESRRRILDAAEELFAERGYERTSVVDIAERSGISRGSIPWHFKNKEGVLVAVVERALQRYLEPESMGTCPSDDFVRILEQVKAWMRHPTASMLYTVLSEAIAGDGPVRASFVEFQRKARTDLVEVLEGFPTTFSHSECQALAAVFNGAFIGLHLQWTIDPSVDLDGGIDSLGRLMRETVIAATPAPEQFTAPS